MKVKLNLPIIEVILIVGSKVESYNCSLKCYDCHLLV